MKWVNSTRKVLNILAHIGLVGLTVINATEKALNIAWLRNFESVSLFSLSKHRITIQVMDLRIFEFYERECSDETKNDLLEKKLYI